MLYIPLAVNAGKGCFLQKDGEAVLGDNLLDDLHHDAQVLVNMDGVDSGSNSNWPGGLELVRPLVGAPPS